MLQYLFVFLIVLFATLIFIGFKNCLPTRIFPETKASGSNVVVDSLMLEAISGKEIDKVLSQANDSLAQEQRLKKSDQYLFSFFKKLEELEKYEESYYCPINDGVLKSMIQFHMCP